MAKMTVNIAGKDYNIVSEESGEYVNQLAYFLNEQISTTARGYVGVGTASVVTLVALNLADELHKSKAALESLEEQMEEIRDALRKTEIELSMKAAPKQNSISRKSGGCKTLPEAGRGKPAAQARSV